MSQPRPAPLNYLQILQELYQEYGQMGFSQALIKQAYDSCNDRSKVLDLLFQLSEQNQKMIQEADMKKVPQSAGDDYELEMNKAIEASLKEAKGVVAFEPLNPEQRLRKSGMPVGLKNIGNTCYVNSLLQTYFSNEKFVKAVLDFDPESKIKEEALKSPQKGGEKDVKQYRVTASVKLVKHLQKLFAMMIRSHKKYVDPTNVLNTVVDDMGNPIPIGDQKDITEFNINFLSRIDEALQQNSDRSKLPKEDETIQISSQLTRKHSVALHQEDSVVSQIFFGRMKELKYFVQDSERMAEEEETIFGPVILDIGQKDLYTSWESGMMFNIDDYRLANGERTIAEKSNWLLRAPETLFFQLQRVVFDKENGVVKLNTPFHFEKEIYIDRFLLQNKDVATKIKVQVDSLKAHLTALEQALAKMNNYNDSNMEILKILDLSTEFLKAQIIEEKLDVAQKKNRDPTRVGILESKEQCLISVNILSQYKQLLENQKSDLEKKIEQTKAEIENKYSSLKNHKYLLYSILIHDGVAGSGHYYSFIRDIDTDAWKRYNDLQVSEEKEEIVMRESLGGCNNSNAYCLCYMSEKSYKEGNNWRQSYLQTQMIIEGKDIEIPKQHYSSLLSEHLRMEVDEDNLVFAEEIKEYKFQNFLKNVLEEYQKRYDAITQSYQQTKNQEAKNNLPPQYNSFALYLKNDPGYEKILKWYLLDTTLKDMPHQAEPYKLREMKKHPLELRILENRISSLPKTYALTNLVLAPEDEWKIDAKLAQYLNDIPKVIYLNFMTESSINENWMDFAASLKKLQDDEQNSQSFFLKLAKDEAKISMLLIALKIESLIKGQKWDKTPQIHELSDILLGIAKGFFKTDDAHQSQVAMIINELVTLNGDKMPPEMKDYLKDWAYRFKTTFYITAELDNLVKDYAPKELQERLGSVTGEHSEPYKYQSIDDNSQSAMVKRNLDRFKAKYKAYLEFHNALYKDKQAMKHDDRIKHNFYYAESMMNIA
jgi:ubiquitin carboxyl-terminal hydrolase 25/28